MNKKKIEIKNGSVAYCPSCFYTSSCPFDTLFTCQEIYFNIIRVAVTEAIHDCRGNRETIWYQWIKFPGKTSKSKQIGGLGKGNNVLY